MYVYVNINIHSNDKKGESIAAVSAFTTGNYHCKPLTTDVIVIYNIRNEK